MYAMVGQHHFRELNNFRFFTNVQSHVWWLQGCVRVGQPGPVRPGCRHILRGKEPSLRQAGGHPQSGGVGPKLPHERRQVRNISFMAPIIKIDSKFTYFGTDFLKRVQRFDLRLQILITHSVIETCRRRLKVGTCFKKSASKVSKSTINDDK